MSAGPTVTAILKADDEASAVLRAIAKIATQTANEMNKMGKESGLANSLKEAEAAARRNEAVFSRMHNVLKEMGATARQVAKDVAALAGPLLLHETWSAAKGGAKIQSQDVQNAVAGMSPAEVQSAAAQSAKLAGQFPLVETSEVMQLYREMRSVMKDTSEVAKMLPSIVQAKSVLDGADPSGKSSEGLLYAMRSAELFGMGNDPAKFRAYLDSYVKATQVEGRTINSEGLMEFAQMAKSSAATLSPNFVNGIAPLLVQEMGGGRAGTSTDQFIKQVVGGFQGNLHAAAKEFVSMGLANHDDFETTKTGEIKGLKSGRHVKDYDIASSDPSKWVWDTLIPALKAHGFDSQEKMLNEVRRLFPNGNAANIVSKLIQQEDQWKAKEVRIADASGLAAGDKQKEDATVQIKAVATAFDNLISTLSSPGMKNIALVLNGIAESLGKMGERLSKWQGKNPLAGEVIGDAALGSGAIVGAIATYATVSKIWQAMTGQGASAQLAASATALDGSALALKEAAAALMGKGALPGAGGPGVGKGNGPQGFGISGLLTGFNLAGLAWNAPDIGTPEGQKRMKENREYINGIVKGFLPSGWVGDDTHSITSPADAIDEAAANARRQRDAHPDMARAIAGEHADPRLPDYAPHLGNLVRDLDRNVKVDTTVEGKVTGEATLHITVDANGMKTMQTGVNLNGALLGKSQFVPSSGVPGGIGHQ